MFFKKTHKLFELSRVCTMDRHQARRDWHKFRIDTYGDMEIAQHSFLQSIIFTTAVILKLTS